MQLSTRELTLAALFTAIMCILTIMVRVFQPIIVVPFSLQPLVMLVAALVLSPRGAFLSMLAYVLLGLIGLPVFSVPPYGGVAYVLLPTFGFLLGFPLAAWVQSRLIYRKSLLNFLFAGVVGIAVYYLIGLPYMYLILNYYLGQNLNVIYIIKIGLLPFIVFDLLKVLLASVLVIELSRRLGIEREFYS